MFCIVSHSALRSFFTTEPGVALGQLESLVLKVARAQKGALRTAPVSAELTLQLSLSFDRLVSLEVLKLSRVSFLAPIMQLVSKLPNLKQFWIFTRVPMMEGLETDCRTLIKHCHDTKAMFVLGLFDYPTHVCPAWLNNDEFKSHSTSQEDRCFLKWKFQRWMMDKTTMVEEKTLQELTEEQRHQEQEINNIRPAASV